MTTNQPKPRTEPFRFDLVDLEFMRLRGRLSAGARLQATLAAWEWVVNAMRRRLQRLYPDLSPHEINLKVLEEIENQAVGPPEPSRPSERNKPQHWRHHLPAGDPGGAGFQARPSGGDGGGRACCILPARLPAWTGESGRQSMAKT